MTQTANVLSAALAVSMGLNVILAALAFFAVNALRTETRAKVLGAVPDWARGLVEGER